MSLTVHYFNHNGDQLIDCRNVYEEDEKYFQDNDIKVSMEELKGEIIVYGCPYSDESEESELIVFAKDNSCEDTLQKLAKMCRNTFGDKHE